MPLSWTRDEIDLITTGSAALSLHIRESRLSRSTHLSRPRVDVFCFLLDVGRLGAEAERLCRDAVAGADAAVGVGKGVVAEADGGGDCRTGGGGRSRPLRKGNEAAQLQAALRRVIAADARFPNCARPSTAPELGEISVARDYHFLNCRRCVLLTVSEMKELNQT